MVKVELLTSPGCQKCAAAQDSIRELIASFGSDQVTLRDVDVLDELDYAVSLGVLTIPAIAIDGALVFTSLPTTDALRAELAKHLRLGGGK
ncbi:MAG: thioredoxin family protein [Ralstonia sp.]|jgi:thioredoxin 1|uniref:Thioredoxin-like fold domain-containing protein n=2 Tax=Ralstonia TaxID=48736 RepID=A0ABN9IYL6_9RALS|nr:MULTISPECIES: thioredoxin family protein [Ralstonia]MBA9845268.1 glutaredoxin [Ralstonia pickettii]MBA9852340.1 glutaredoxin [Ralstonia pickettii]MBA9878688.1 glutaredoxin [Ralstonia pickettii]MBA9881921.1 glutaredoxin [Ralstonia pickettii]MBA9888764.1 glutaredoxin [Ralstonia pickettii]